MTVLRDNLTASIQAFQQLLDEQVITCQAGNMRLASDTSGRPSSDDDENTLTNRNPFSNDSALK